MPQIQVLPEVPSFGSELRKVLSEAGAQIGEGLLKRSQQNQLKEILGKYTTPAQGTQVGAAMQEGQQPQQQGGRLDLMGLASDPAALQAFTAVNPQYGAAIINAAKMQGEQQKIGISQQKLNLAKQKDLREQGIMPEPKKIEYAGVADRVEKLSMENPWGKRISPFNEGGAELNALGEHMFSAIRDKIAKGNMSKPVFDYIKNNVTVSKYDTNAQIKGKLNAFRRYAQVLKDDKDYSNFTIDDAKRIAGKENIEKAGMEGQKTLTKSSAQQFLKAADGDKEQARKMAKEAGYDF